MKKNIFILLSLITLFTGLNNTANCQDPKTNLDKYWHYRYRLTQYFEKVGMRQGMSLPASIRNGPTNVSASVNQMYWGDSPLQLGYYIGVLATEYKLLNDNGQDVTETVRELYYALHTVYRLDSLGYITYHYAGHPAGPLPSPFPGNGYMIRDDISQTWQNDNNASINLNLTQANDPGWSNNSGQPSWIDPSIAPECNYSSGPGGGIDGGVDVYGNLLIGLNLVLALVPDDVFSWTETDAYGNNINYNIGRTNYSVDYPTGFSSSYPISPVTNQSETIRQMAHDLGTQLINYMAATNSIQVLTVTIADPNTFIYQALNIFNYWDGKATLITSTVPFGLVEPNGGTVQNGEGGWPASAAISEPLASMAYTWYGLSITADATIGYYAWNGYYNSCTFGLFKILGYEVGSIDGVHNDDNDNVAGCYYATASNYGSVNSDQNPMSTTGKQSALDMINFLGNGSYCGDGVNLYGRDIFYGGLLQVLYHGTYNPLNWDICDAEDMLNSAPWDGPFNHGDAGIAPGGWACDRRFVDAEGNGTGPSGQTAFNGNYNGLDYMLLYNVFCIMNEQVQAVEGPVIVGQDPSSYVIPNGPATYASASPTPLPDYYPCDVPSLTFWDPLGVPSAYALYGPGVPPENEISGYSGEPIEVTKLTVAANQTIYNGYNEPPYTTVSNINGNLTLTGCSTSYIDLNPTQGNIFIQQGTYFDANCNLDCCSASAYPYLYEDFQTKRPVTYQKTEEFDTAYASNGIRCYPNPFTDQTTISFTLNNNKPISIYIIDMAGKIINELVSNESYSKGSHVLNYSGYNLANGNYFCVLETKTSKYSFKMIKTK